MFILRSWNNLYCVLTPGQLSAYKDAKSFGHGSTYQGETPLSITNANWECLSNYKKKRNVAKLRWVKFELVLNRGLKKLNKKQSVIKENV